MTEFVADCPRCQVRGVTFLALADNPLGNRFPCDIEAYAWCRACQKTSIALFHVPGTPNLDVTVVNQGRLSSGQNRVAHWYVLQGFVSLLPIGHAPPPEFLPENVGKCFAEGASSFAIGAFNAAAAMFRLSLDLATKQLLPNVDSVDGGPNQNQRKRLYDRIGWLIDNGLLDRGLHDLAECVREDGNDGAHDGTLTKVDAEDLVDFTRELLERVYTEPERLRLARERRVARRAQE